MPRASTASSATCPSGRASAPTGLTGASWAQDLVPVPALHARVTDLTRTLSADQTARLEQKLAAFEARKGSQIAVLIVPSTGPEPIEAYSIRVAEQWKLGRKGVDDGALLLVAKDDRALCIEVGQGLEGALPDVVAKRIIELTGSSSKIVFEPPLLFMTQLGLPDLTRAKEQLAWLPLVSLEQGLKRSIEYTIAHRGLIRPTLGK